MTGYISEVRTSNGTYYVGMTKQQAKEQSIFDCKIGIDFKDLDTDNSGDLDQREILVGAKNQAERNGILSGIMTGVMGLSTALCTVGDCFTGGTLTGAVMLGTAATALHAEQTGEAIDEYNEAARQLEEYDKEHGIAQKK